MRILAIEGYYGGSHKAFLDGWAAQSKHAWELLTLPPNKWKWRMRHGAVTLAEWVSRRVSEGASWDVVFCSDMLNLAEFRGLAPQAVRQLPTVVYFHENQLTYPVQVESERDYQYVMTNFTTALAADAVWFNSAFHRDEFLQGLVAFFKRMPDYHPLAQVGTIRAKSGIQPPGIDPVSPSVARRPGPARLLWAARWEHDKNPEDFFAAIDLLRERGLDFRLHVIGEQFREQPEVFEQARRRFADRIDRWGYQPGRAEYEAVLADSDVVVSTANHEFFGLSVLEAIAAGALPLLPDRLAYPEILAALAPDEQQMYLYDGDPVGLANRLQQVIRSLEGSAPPSRGKLAEPARRQYAWPARAQALDASLERAVRSCR